MSLTTRLWVEEGNRVAGLGDLLPQGLSLADPEEIRQNKRLQSLGVVGAALSFIVLVGGNAIAQLGGTFSALLSTLLVGFLVMLGWARLWVRESKEPFQYTYSVAEFRHLDPEHSGDADGPICRLGHDLKEKLSQRVGRLSLLDEETVPATRPGDEPASHVHIGGWHSARCEDHWFLEVVPEVRLGGVGAPGRLARSVRLRLDQSTSESMPVGQAPKLTAAGYAMLFERVYWSVASEIYAQIQLGVEKKVRMLPRGSLRAAAYVHEADDYAESNTLEAYVAAQSLYRRALAIYDRRYRDPSATRWRLRYSALASRVAATRQRLRRDAAEIWRGAAKRELMCARAELGLARMLGAEWHLGRLCGIPRRDIHEATTYISHALDRLQGVPDDLPEKKELIFRAHVTKATLQVLLKDYPGSRDALKTASRLLPAKVHEDADYLFAAGMAEPDRLLSLRLFGQAVELDPTMERALFHRAQEYDEIWRRRDPLEAEVATTIDAGYRAVISLDPGNLSAWGRRGYVGWLLAEDGNEQQRRRWRERARSALETGRQYKEVRREASVAELDWNLARLAGEEGDFAAAYDHYIAAVSARLGDPRIDFEDGFYLTSTTTLVKRFRRYEERVAEAARRAEADQQVPARLIKSVLAFVLNDCGLAYQANYDRSGNVESLTEAHRAFEQAELASSSFVLPIYNRAKLELQRSRLPGTSDEETEAALACAAEKLDDLLLREREWAPGLLLTVEVQASRVLRIQQRLAGLGYDVDDPAQLPPTTAERTGAQVVQLLHQRAECLASAVAALKALLPHGQLDGDGASRIDASGNGVPSLVNDKTIRWTKDFDLFHVEGLAKWAQLLVVTNPAAADRLCRKLRDVYCNADAGLLSVHLDAAEALLAHDPGNADAEGVRRECAELVGKIVFLALQEDPVHWTPMRYVGLLTEEQQRRCFKAALHEEPSAIVLLLIGDGQRDLRQLDEAVRTYLRARDGKDEQVAAIASLRLAGLFEEQGDRQDDAIRYYDEAAKSPDVPLAALAVAGAGRVLLARGNAGRARSVTLRATDRPELTTHLAAQLASESREDEAAEVYRTAIAAETNPELLADLRIRLAVLVSSPDGNPSPEAQALFGNVIESRVQPFKWEAEALLARQLSAGDPARARALYQEALAAARPEAVAVLSWELAEVMQDCGEAEASAALLRERALMDPDVAEFLIEMKRRRGDEDADAFAAEVSPSAAVPVAGDNGA